MTYFGYLEKPFRPLQFLGDCQVVAETAAVQGAQMHNLRQLDETLLVEVCQRFIDKMRPTDIAEWLSTKVDDRVNREEIYPLIREAIDRGYFSILPPVNELMRQRIADRYRKGKDKDRIHVVANQTVHPVRVLQRIDDRIHRALDSVLALVVC